MDAPIERRVRFEIRACEEADLPKLEWFGAFTQHREIIAKAFAAHRRREGLMLVADLNGFPVGQVWVKLAPAVPRGTALLWALRVMEPFRRLGLASALIGAAERAAAARGCERAEIGIDRDDCAARALYERLGYSAVEPRRETFAYTTPAGERRIATVDQYIFAKSLTGAKPP